MGKLRGESGIPGPAVPIIAGIFCITVLPFIFGTVDGTPPDQIPLLVGTTLLLEYGAGAVGITLGISPLTTFLVIASVGLGVITLLFSVFGLIGRKSERVAGFLERSGNRAKRHRLLWRYGIIGLVPATIIVGIYVTPAIAWVMRWDVRKAGFLILSGYLSAAVLTLLGTLGFLRLIGF